MNDPGDIPLTHTSTPDSRPPCSIISIIPTIGMSSCRGRAEAFARSLSSKLRTLGSQTNEEGEGNAEDEPIINGTNTNTWVNSHDSEQTVTDLQPLRHESDSFFDFDCELESPGSPVDECEYLRLIETASNTPHNSTAESGYACASVASSHSSSTDGPYFDASASGSATVTVTATATATQAAQDQKLPASEVKDYVNSLQLNGNHELENGVEELSSKKHEVLDEDESFLQAQILSELQKQSNSVRVEEEKLTNGHLEDELQEQAVVEAEDKSQTEVANTKENAPDRTQEELPTNETSSEEKALQEITSSIPQDRIPTEGEPTPKEEDVASAGDTVDTIVLEDTSNDVELSPDSGVDETDKSASNLTVNVELAHIEQAKQDAAEAVEKRGGHSHGIDTTDDEDDCRPQRIRRCSSLKTGKTPPGTPGRKKIVRFADVLGLDLADVKTFLDEIPTIPKSAFEDLEILESEPPLQLGPKSDKLLMPLFQQPGGLPTFLDAVREKQVSLENAAVTDNINQTISGSVRVRNLDFHKSVHIRYSLDGWRSYADLQANYVENSCDGFSDKFTFVLFGNSLHVGQRLEFACRFQCKGQQFWDNNYGANYCFQCLPSSTHPSSGSSTVSPPSVVTGAVTSGHGAGLVGLLSPTAGDAWCSSFY
ncbi:glycogen-binding subunit 76A [Drosophila bipectinata]|uniref:glycogen-binding subunit 76A n=1 Tax=Drosophila bipectinata TaxID=42026 RepID=UPI001C8AD0FB|nr:glycogen-binding subunit 76A [Drosophila bipectinata]XP_017107711.2 glycogen-binding subunit 76A [Drosophila bipectinata]